MFSKYSVKKPYTVIVGIILVIVLGVISFQHMTTDLLPSMDLPYVVVYTTYVGATPEQVEGDVTRPMEAAFATLTDVKKITSQSRDNVSVVIMQFNDGANMDTALIEISSRLDQLRGDWSDDIGAPVAMKLNPDMLPVAILSVTRDDMDILALSDYVEDELVPAFEALNGVASAEASGVITQRIDVTIEQSRIDVLNAAILKDVDKELSEVEDKLNDAQGKLSDGKKMLARARRQATKQLDDAEAAIEKGAEQLPAAIEQLTGQRDALQKQRDELAKNVAALDKLVNMDDEQKAQLQQMSQALGQLRQQREALEKQLEAAQAAAGDTSELEAAIAEVQTQRDALAETLAQQQQYLSDLKLLDADALKEEIAALEEEIAGDESALETASTELDALKTRREELSAQVDDLTRRLKDAEAGSGDNKEDDGKATAAPDATPSNEGEEGGETAAPAETGGETTSPGATEGTTGGEAGGETTSPDAEGDAPSSPEGEGSGDAAEGTTGDGAGGETTSSDTAQTPEGSGDATGDGAGGETTSPDAAQTPEGSGDATEGKSSDGASGETASPDTADAVPPSPKGEGSEDTSDAQEPSTKEANTKPSSEAKNSDSSPASQKPSPLGEGAERSEADEVVPSPASEKPSTPAGVAENAVAPAPKAETPKPTETPRPTEAPEIESNALALGAALAEEATPAELREQLTAAEAALAQLDKDIETKSAEVETLSKGLETKRGTLKARQDALDTLAEGNENIKGRMEAAQKQIDSLTERVAALDGELEGLNGQLAALTAAPDAIQAGIDQIDAQIEAITGSEAYQALLMLEDPEGLNAQYVEAQAGLAQMDAGLKQMDETLEKLNNGVIPGGMIEGVDQDTSLEDARAQLKAGRKQMASAFATASSQLKDAEGELAKARKEFNEQRDEALENAGLDGVITLQTVSALIGAQNIAMPAGYVYDAENEQVLVRVGDKFDTLDGVRRMKLFKLGLDSVDEIRLLDVAKVELTDDREDVFTKLNGQDGILLSLDKQSTYSTADVAKAVMAKARALAEENPNLHIVDLMNQGEYISIIVDSVLNNLLSGGGLAILILLLFLMDFRPTITVAFSIPISVVIAFVCMYFTGITLNVLSLSGLSLGIGMLVDNSIVAIENIYRLHDEEGVPLLRACVEGVRSVSGALFSSTLTTICVFLPIVFVQGMARDLFADMGLTIAYSLLASLFVAMTVVPAMCSFLMRHSKPHRHRVFGAIQRFYAALLRGALRFKPLVLLAALALLVFSAMQVPKMGISFMPEVNSRQMSADLAFDPDMTDQARKDQAVAIMDDMMQVEGVESIGLMGSGTGILSSGSNMSYYINIDEALGRKNADIAREMDEIGKKHNADLTVQASTMDISMMTGSGIQVEITGDDIETLQAIALDVAELARQTEGTADVSDGLEEAVPELRVEVDKEKATDEGLTTGQILQFVAQKVAGRVEITQVTLDGKELSIYLEDGANSELRPEDLEDLEIEVDKESENKLVRIGDVANIRETESLSTISRASQRRMVTVSFAIAEGYSANLVSDAFAEKLHAYALPAGYSADLAGENETVMGIMEDLVWMVLVAILLIFLIMVAQFQSFKSPIIVMFTIPLAFTGGLLALLLSGMDLSIVSMLGFLVLSGVVVNNGIVFIDCVNQLRIGGMEKREALVETGRIRLRPILMTALTTILGMSTMALGHGTGAEMMQPMAVVSIGGLSYATLMTLFIVPVLYDLLNGKTMKAREIQMIKEAAGMTGDEVLEGEDRVESARAIAAEGAEAPAARAEGAAEASAEAPAVETIAKAEGNANAEGAAEASAEAPAVEAIAEAESNANAEGAAEASAEAPAVEAIAEAEGNANAEAPAVEAIAKAEGNANAEGTAEAQPAPEGEPKPAAKPLRIRMRPRMPF